MLFYFGHQMLYGTVLHHDIARPLAAHHITQLLTNNNIQILPTAFPVPPNKHTWNELDRPVQSRVTAPADVRESFQALKQE